MPGSEQQSPPDGQISRQLEGLWGLYLDQALDLEQETRDPTQLLPLTCPQLWAKSCPALGLNFLIFTMGLTRPPLQVVVRLK